MASINSTVENFILIWLDKNLTEISDEYRQSIHQFQSFVNTIKFFSNANEFRQFIQQIIDEKLFIIISGSFGEQLVPEIENQSQILAIYVYCNQKEYHQKWSKDFRKVKGVFTDLHSICNAFRRDIRQANQDLISINLLSATNSNESFYCSLLLKEILNHIKSNDGMKNQLIEYSRLHYRENSFALSVIDEYEKYNAHQISSITWYTRECFLSSMLHRGLRLYDVDILNKLAFFIQDLNQQIQDLHSKSTDNRKLTVYYGQGMPHDQYEKFKINDLITFNSFLLTTIDKELSVHFAKQSGKDGDFISILYQIEIDPSITSFPFVSLDQLDYYHDTDQYILFSLNAIFRIVKIEHLEENFWQMNLILIDDHEKQLEDLKKTRKSKGFFSLGQMLFEMNDWHKAKNILEKLLQNTHDTLRKDLASIHRMLGRIYQKKNDFTNAFAHYDQCLKTQLSYLSPNNPFLSATFAALGAISEKLGNLDQALEYFKRAADTNGHNSKIDPSIIAFYYISIGRILAKQGENLQARKNLELALEFEEKSVVHNENYRAEIQHYLTIIV